MDTYTKKFWNVKITNIIKSLSHNRYPFLGYQFRFEVICFFHDFLLFHHPLIKHSAPPS